MEDRKLATRYARALLDAVPDPRGRESVDVFMRSLGEAVAHSAQLRILLNPAVPRSVRTRALCAVAEREAQPPVLGRFLETVVQNGRVAALPAIAEAYHRQLEDARGIVPATLVTAETIQADLQERARAALERLTGRKVRLSCSVDPSLLGGAVARIGSMVYDGSLHTQLANLRRRMAEE